MYAQAYFDYDSKKSGGVTMSHLRFGKKPIKSTYLIHKADFVACHNPSYVNKYNMVQELVDGGTFLLNCPWNMDELEKHLPGQVKAFIANHNIKFYVIESIWARRYPVWWSLSPGLCPAATGSCGDAESSGVVLASE